ncbi:MAG: ferredoxin [Desulfococcaceae bacterium]|jgi:ferredoxin|nr:ferredoxin [Desulfococcaceae bacterium]
MIQKTPQNVPGRFYVHINCINCSLCSEAAGNLFGCNHEEGYEYVRKQPQNPEELDLMEEMRRLCPADAIRDGG